MNKTKPTETKQAIEPVTTKNEVVKPVEYGDAPTVADMFEIADIKNIFKRNPYILLIQGNNPLKDEFGYQEGDIVTTDTNKVLNPIDKATGERLPVAITLIKYERVYVELPIDEDPKDSKPIQVLTSQEYLFEKSKQLWVTESYGDKGIMLWNKRIDNEETLERMFRPIVRAFVLVDGQVYQISFKGFVKISSFETMSSQIMQACSTLKIPSPLGVKVNLGVRKTQKKDTNIKYYEYTAKFSTEPATQEEFNLATTYYNSTKFIDLLEDHGVGFGDEEIQESPKATEESKDPQNG